MQTESSHLPTPAAETAPSSPKKEDDSVVTCLEFEDMNLSPEVFRGILSYGFEKPSVIQQQAIPLFVANQRDIIAQAQSGTGKTATFSISILQKIDCASRTLQAVVLAPTRELAEQICTVMTALGQFLDVNIMLISGGTPLRQNIQEIKDNFPHIIIATPGRLSHMFRDAYLSANNIKMLVMDEADEMLSHGFQDQIRDLIERMPRELQIGLYSATITREMEDIAQKFMRDPAQIKVKADELTLEGIKQYYIAVTNDYYKTDTLIDLFSEIPVYQMMIYCNSKKNTDILCRQLQHSDIPCSSIHSDMSSEDRRDIMKKFRSGEVRVLITTDLLCRGIDVQQVSLVINYDFPRQKESYIHRIGRSGRFGRKGYAINLITSNDTTLIRDTEEFYETSIMELPLDIKTAIGGGN